MTVTLDGSASVTGPLKSTSIRRIPPLRVSTVGPLALFPVAVAFRAMERSPAPPPCVRALRHADQLSIAMDARGFGAGPRSVYRPISWTRLDAIVGASALAILVAALLASA